MSETAFDSVIKGNVLLIAHYRCPEEAVEQVRYVSHLLATAFRFNVTTVGSFDPSDVVIKAEAVAGNADYSSRLAWFTVEALREQGAPEGMLPTVRPH